VRRATTTAAALVALAAIAALATTASLAAATACKPPRGPGDNLVHSTHLRAYRVSCHIARVVVLRSTRHRAWFEGTEGFYVAGRRWVCHSTALDPVGFREHCRSGYRRVSIRWLD
jgi:hypothetical protein